MNGPNRRLVPTFQIGAAWRSADRISGRWGALVREVERRHNRRPLGRGRVMGYNLTDQQKKLLKWIVQEVREGNLSEEFSVAWTFGGCVLADYEGDPSNVPKITPALLDALAEAGMILCKPSHKMARSGRLYEASRTCVLKGQAYEAVDTNFEPSPPQSVSQITIGALIHTMSGGNVQAVGVAQNAEISQVIGDPDLMRSQVEALTESLLNEVRSVLGADELVEYAQAVRDLREQLLAEKPDPSLIRKLLRTLGLLGDIEGTLGLMTRVWSLLHPLLLIAAARLG